jgi:ribonuclease VapC
MIAVDSSAILAILLGEANADRFAAPLSGMECVIGWPTVFEIHLALFGKGKRVTLEAVDLWRHRPNVAVVPFDEPAFNEARKAFGLFGRGSGHPARLNFGDCMAYAIAKVHDVPLLYKGDDFSHTDIRAALP